MKSLNSYNTRLQILVDLPGAEAKYGTIFKNFFSSDLSNFWKCRDKFKFSRLALLFMHVFIKIHPNMSEQEKKQQKISELQSAETKPTKFPK